MFGKKSATMQDYASPFRPLSAEEIVRFREIYPTAVEADRLAEEALELPGKFKIQQLASDGLWYVYRLEKSGGMYALNRILGKSFRLRLRVDDEEDKNYDKRTLVEAWDKGERPAYHVALRPMGKKIDDYKYEGFTTRKLAEKFLHDAINPVKEGRIYDERGELLSVEPIDVVKPDLTDKPSGQ